MLASIVVRSDSRNCFALLVHSVHSLGKKIKNRFKFILGSWRRCRHIFVPGSVASRCVVNRHGRLVATRHSLWIKIRSGAKLTNLCSKKAGPFNSWWNVSSARRFLTESPWRGSWWFCKGHTSTINTYFTEIMGPPVVLGIWGFKSKSFLSRVLCKFHKTVINRYLFPMPVFKMLKQDVPDVVPRL